MSNTGRWTLAALVAVIALVVALWPRASDDEPSADGPSSVQTGQSAPADPGAVAQARTQAALTPCPGPTGQESNPASPLAGITLDCLADGRPVDLAAALHGKPALLNLWAYWCAPCATELPYMQQFASRAGSAITVLTVHSDLNQVQALTRLTDLSVHLPGVEDAAGRVRTAVGAPPVLPVSVLVRADGTVAQVLAQPFHSVDDIAAAVKNDLGVAA